MSRKQVKQGATRPVEKVKGGRKKRILILIAIFLVVLLFWGVWQIGHLPCFSIQTVRVQGNLTSGEQSSVKQLTQSFLPANLFSIDMDALQKSLLQFPWLVQVDVRRVWPNQLMIQIRKPVLVAAWNDQEYLNEYGEILTNTVDIASNDLPQFYGQDKDAFKMLSYYQSMNEILKALKLSVTTITLSMDGDWKITLNNGMKVELGDEDVLTKLARFVKVYDKVFNSHGKAAKSVDLRYAHGMAVQW